MPDKSVKETKSQIKKDSDEIVRRVMKIMDWDIEKGTLWLYARNPNLGGAAPIDFVYVGRTHKVMRFIDNAEDENSPLEEGLWK